MHKYDFIVIAGYKAVGCTMLSVALDQVVAFLEDHMHVRMLDIHAGKIYTYDDPNEAPVTREIQEEYSYEEDEDD
ncbi:hypothetical protein KAMAJI_00140 [Serratia phage vB_SmaM-Kamaji]|nr:hypothetical protein KAMAJI_00140 [Serratia phage vB_SmaM-Kamaji]